MTLDNEPLEPEEEPGGQPAGGEPEQQAAPESPPAGPRMVQIGNLTVPEEEVLSLLEFQTWARANPDKMDAFGQYLRGEAQFTQPEKAKEPEIDWDVVDPNIRSAYDQQSKRMEDLQARLSQMEAPINAIQQDQLQRARFDAEQALNAASGRMMDRFKLNEDEMEELAGDAAKLNLVPSLRAQGMMPQQALETALETAFWQNEKWRKRVVDEEVAARGADGRKARASQVTGTSGASGDGLDSQPRDEGERRRAMAAEIAEAMRGTA